MEDHVLHEKRITKIYLRELFPALALYTVRLPAAVKFGRPIDPGVLRTIVLASPLDRLRRRRLCVCAVQLVRKLLDP
jgi:hypothetical protein